MASIQPFQIAVPDAEIEKLHQRLSLATFPDELDEAAWDLGAPLADVKRLANYWKENFDWRKSEEKLNQLPNFTTHIQAEGFESLRIHFVHQKSDVKGAIPLLFVHGWPGSFVEVSKILPQLPKGDQNSPAFHVVALSLPNYGFSEGSKKRGFGLAQYAETCNKLMLQLGYDEYVTQGGDWGLMISRTIGKKYPQHCKASHINMIMGSRPSWTKQPLVALQHAVTPYSPRDLKGLARTDWFMNQGSGYRAEQSTKPQTIGYAFADSPVALLAWIYEKLHDWTDSYPWTDDEVLTWISIYWFSTAGPAANVRIYYEATHTQDVSRDDTMGWIPNVKLGLTHFPQELRVLPKTWARGLGPIVYESENDSGGHFAAWEKPEVIVNDLRQMFGKDGGAFGVVKGKDGYEHVSSKL